MADFRHRALRHHTEGILLAEQLFGTTITTTGSVRQIPVRRIDEQHFTENPGFIPSTADWLHQLQLEP